MTTPSGKQRIEGFDVARSIAILGMVIVHFGMTLAVDGGRKSSWTWLLDALDGRAAALFLLLAGVGIAVRSTRAHDEESLDKVRRSVLHRGLFLLAAGWLLLLVWPGDILRVYGVTMLVASRLLTIRNAWLFALIGGTVGGFVLLFCTLDYFQNWEWESMNYRNLWTASGQVRNLFFDGFRSVLPWSAFLLLGMWLGRRDWMKPRTAWNCFLLGTAAALAIEGLSRVLVAAASTSMDSETAVALFGPLSMPPLPVFLLAAASTAIAVVGASVLLAAAFRNRLWLSALASTGQLAFTWYVAHIILGLGAVDELGLIGTQTLETGILAGLGFFAFAALLSLAYKQWFRQGPLEWLLRTVAG